jgi:hypothetical protein
MDRTSDPALLEPVYQALRLQLPKLRQSPEAAVQLAAALEICASDVDEQAERLRADILHVESVAS